MALGQRLAALPFSADPLQSAPLQHLSAPGLHGPAGETLIAVSVRHARAVGAVEPLDVSIVETGQRSITVLTPTAGLMPCRELATLLLREHGSDPSPSVLGR
jgi:hypothetical protein